MRLKIIVGCPISDRAWILPRYLECVHAQVVDADIELLFHCGKSSDNTEEIIKNSNAKKLLSNDIGIGSNKRTWNMNRYKLMAGLRNRLLEEICRLDPDYYFSLDSDILIPEDCVARLLAREKDAISPLMSMIPNGMCPNVMTFRENSAYRKKSYMFDGKPMKADVIMAAVLMNRRFYRKVRYREHKLGEDVGWSFDARDKGFELWLDPSIKVRHVMRKELL